MIDVNALAYATLNGMPLAPAVPVFFEEADGLPDEYIVFDRIYGDDRNHADNKPLHEYVLMRVDYYGKNKARRQVAMTAIKAAMTAAGFFTQAHNINIPREAGAAYWGAYSEFSYWAVIS